MRSSRFSQAFDKLAAAEELFLKCEFLAPVVDVREVQVRIAGIVMRLRVSPADFRGFGIFQPTSPSTASLVRPATLTQRRDYLALFPLVRLILCKRHDAHWLALPAHRGDQRFQITGLVPVRMVEEAQQFEVVRTRYDGTNFWFEAIDSTRDPAAAAWLREQLSQASDPNLLDRPGLTPEQRLAYALNVIRPTDALQTETEPASRLRAALAQAGADLIDYLERDDGYRVAYSIGGQQHVSAVRKDDLTVQVAGICLSGEDERFDLTSLVGVLREAEGEGVVRVGHGGIEEEIYWRAHPPRNQ